MLILYVHTLRLFVHIHTYIFIQTKTQHYSDTLLGGSLAEKKYVETLWGGPLGENPKKTKKKKETKPIVDPAIPMVRFLFVCLFFSFFLFHPKKSTMHHVCWLLCCLHSWSHYTVNTSSAFVLATWALETNKHHWAPTL